MFTTMLVQSCNRGIIFAANHELAITPLNKTGVDQSTSRKNLFAVCLFRFQSTVVCMLLRPNVLN